MTPVAIVVAPGDRSSGGGGEKSAGSRVPARPLAGGGGGPVAGGGSGAGGGVGVGAGDGDGVGVGGMDVVGPPPPPVQAASAAASAAAAMTAVVLNRTGLFGRRLDMLFAPFVRLHHRPCRMTPQAVVGAGGQRRETGPVRPGFAGVTGLRV